MHVIFGQFLTVMALDRCQNFVYAQSLVNEYVDFDQILNMHWYWQDVDLDDWKMFFVHFQQMMDLDWCRNFVYAQYLVVQLMDFGTVL